jgi:hypothetical protein
MSDFDKFDEYKFLVEDTARFTDRRQNASTLYTSVNSILIAAVSFIVKDLNLLDIFTAFASMVVIVAGLAVCFSWISYVTNYKKLISLRFDVLKEMENHPDMGKSEKIYQREEKELYKADQNKGLFTQIELNLPKIFIALYIIASLGILGGYLAGQFQ